MKEIDILEIQDVCGGTICKCFSYTSAQDMFKNLDKMKRMGTDKTEGKKIGSCWNRIWTRNYGTKSECKKECCEITGGWKGVYGGGAAFIC